jgi:hypothetical protein
MPAGKPESQANAMCKLTETTTSRPWGYQTKRDPETFNKRGERGNDSRGLKKCLHQCVGGIGKQVCERLDLIIIEVKLPAGQPGVSRADRGRDAGRTRQSFRRPRMRLECTSEAQGPQARNGDESL